MVEFLVEAIFFVISIVLGYTLAYFIPGGDNFLLGTLLSLCFYSVSQYLKFVSNFVKLNKSVQQLDRRLITIESRASLRSTILERVMAVFEIKNPLIREAVLSGVKEFSRSISTEDDGVKLQGDQIAINTYEAFWTLLIDEQKKNKAEGLEPLIVRATHSTSINIWRSRRAAILLELQLKFVEEGGEIVRVLIRPGERKESITDYRDAAEVMRKYKISVFVLEVDREAEMESDYLIVDRLYYCFQWNSDSIGRNINGCEIFQSAGKYRHLIGDWRTIVSRLERSKAAAEPQENWKYEIEPNNWQRLSPSREHIAEMV